MACSFFEDVTRGIPQACIADALAQDARDRAEKGVCEFGFLPAPRTKTCALCLGVKKADLYTATQWKKSGERRKCIPCQNSSSGGNAKKRCVYCKKMCTEVTKEHLVVKSQGGSLTLPACRQCNQARGASGRYPAFVDYINKNPGMWIKALEGSRVECLTSLVDWLARENLLKFTTKSFIRHLQA